MSKTEQRLDEERARARELAAEYEAKGDVTGWFDALYRESEGNNELVPWADMKPNRFFKPWADATGLKGDGRKALVVGCGLGDDAVFLDDLGFDVTAFDISPTAIEWAKRLHGDRDIKFETADLFEPFRGWLAAFEFVLEIYTIQPLPLEMRPRVIDAIAGFVAPKGRLVVVCRGRDDAAEPDKLPWPLSRLDLKRFEDNGLTVLKFEEIWDEEDEQERFIVEYQRPDAV